MLPGTSQREFVRTQLFPLLNTLPTRKSKRILRRATRRLKKYQDMPTLDLQSKKTEVNGLLDELSKDIRTSVPPSCVVKDELLKEAVESVAEWLNDIWVVAYEYGAEYMKAHSCLLFSLGILDHVRSMQERCVWLKLSKLSHLIICTLLPTTSTVAGVRQRLYISLSLSNVQTARSSEHLPAWVSAMWKTQFYGYGGTCFLLCCRPRTNILPTTFQKCFLTLMTFSLGRALNGCSREVERMKVTITI